MTKNGLIYFSMTPRMHLISMAFAFVSMSRAANPLDSVLLVLVAHSELTGASHRVMIYMLL